MTIYAKILGTGSYLPEKVVTNYDLEKMLATSHEWIVARTGIQQRHIAHATETASSMATHAARRALESAQIASSALDMIIVATTTPDYVFPSVACLLQKNLDISGCAAFDLNATACAGFMYAFSIADQYIRSGQMQHILVVGSEIMTRVVDWSDRRTCVLFGDGAGAIVLGASETPGILSTHVHADGHYQDILYLPVSESGKTPMYLQMAGAPLFKLAVTILEQLFDETLQKNGLTAEAVDWLVPHQANLRIIHSMAKKLHLPLSRVALVLAQQGNTSSASIPLALDAIIRSNQVYRGQLLMREGFGGGLAWGSALVRY